MPNESALRQTLARLDGKSFRAYRDLAETYRLDGPPRALIFDHIQGDPFAKPTRARIRLSHETFLWPKRFTANPARRIGFADFLSRRILRIAQTIGRSRERIRGSGHSGLLEIDTGGSEVIERASIRVEDDWLEARVEIGLPANGRRILGQEAARLLIQHTATLAAKGMAYPGDEDEETEACWRHLATVENHRHVQQALSSMGLVSFVANGSILPRASGESTSPLEGAVAFRSPESLMCTVPLLHAIDISASPEATERSDIPKSVSGMGIPKGVTLIVGGGFHGKTTLLEAIQLGIYPHIPGDGRELVVTDPGAVKIRAENGRRVERVDISPFISELPFGRGTRAFTSADASGSTSQAAALVEAIELGAETLLFDEDTSATNFMVRDARMQALIPSEQEPIRPLVDWIRRLSHDIGVSSILIMGGSGDYFEQADLILRMLNYRPEDVTEMARAIASERPTGRAVESEAAYRRPSPRHVDYASLDPSKGNKSVSVDARSRERLQFGKVEVDLSGWEQLVERSQTRAIGESILLALGQKRAQLTPDDKRPSSALRRAADDRGNLLSLRDILDMLDQRIDEKGLDILSRYGNSGEHPGRLARARKFEIAAAVNRLRSLRLTQDVPSQPRRPTGPSNGIENDP